MKKLNSYMLKAVVLPLIIFCGLSLPAVCQQSLQPGDTAPDVWLDSFLNRNQPAIHLRQNNPKLVVLDFWNTWCKSCIKALTKLDQLQEKLGNEIRIIAVTDQDSETVSRFFNRTKMQLLHLSVKTGDNLLKQYFPFQSMPHTVWISEGKVEYVTYDYNVNETIIRKFLRGERPKLALKDGNKVYDVYAPLWAGSNRHFKGKPVRYSYLAGWLNDYGSVVNRRFYDSTTKTVGIRMINVPLKVLMLAAYGQEYQPANRVLIESAAAQYVVWDNGFADEDERRVQNKVCYELSVSREERNRIPDLIKADLNRYLDFELKIERRKTRCYVIEQVGGSRTNFKCEEKDKIFSKTTDSFSFCGDFKSLVITLVRENAHDPMPIIDKSGYIGDICVDIKGKLNDIELVKLMLQQYGFKMTEQEIEVNMLVMKDRS